MPATFITRHKAQNPLLNRIKLLEPKIGDTPLHLVSRLIRKNGVQVYAKKEWEQLSGSVKARAAYRIMRQAIESGKLKPGQILLDATSGNTGIAYASIGKEVGIPVTLCLPENASAERKEILASLGATLILTSRFEGTDGAQDQARSLAEQKPGLYYYADQYKNEDNWKAHYYGTAAEIFRQVPDITHFITGLGTTGTFTGTGRKLKELNPEIKIISLQPDNALHGLEGWKHLETAVVPTIYDPKLADENQEISTELAYEMIRRAYDQEGLRLSPSSAANLAAAVRLAGQLDKAVIVTMLPDNGDKYSEILNKILS